jgi:HPt (histidine-containing phosphotransfer) domain-containing protein
MASKSPKPDIITYGDHEVITPDTSKLRKMVRAAQPGDPDPVVSAQQALEQISVEFSSWMDAECDRLDSARRRVQDKGLNEETQQDLFLAAHDIKGNAGLFGFPEVVPAAESLCRLLEHSPDLNRVPLEIVDQHVNAMRAIVRECTRADAAAVAASLTGKLRAVTDEFLIAENQDRPDILKVIKSPGLAPGDF